jgi:hypothetical protein
VAWGFVQPGQLDQPRSLLGRVACEKDELLRDLHGVRGVVLATIDFDETLERRDVSRRALQHLLEGELGAREVHGVGQVEFPEARVDRSLLIRGLEEPAQAYPSLLRGLPVLFARRELGEVGERGRRVRLGGERGQESLASSGVVADLRECASALDLHGHALFGIRDGRDTPLEEGGELALGAAGRVERREPPEDIFVGHVDSRGLLQRCEFPIVFVRVVEPRPCGVVPSGQPVLGDQAETSERFVGFGGALRVPSAPPNTREKTPHDQVAGVLRLRALEQIGRLDEVAQPRRRLAGAEEQSCAFGRTRRLGDEGERRFHDEGVVAPRASMGIEQALRRERGDGLAGRNLRDFQGSVPVAGRSSGA